MICVVYPPALIRPRTSLELTGAVAINYTCGAFNKNIADPTGARTTNGIDRVAFPVLLGGVDDPAGLIGFYLDGADAPGTFYAARSRSGSTGAQDRYSVDEHCRRANDVDLPYRSSREPKVVR
jgi:hypothetical protein